MNHHSPRTSELLTGLLAANASSDLPNGRLTVGDLMAVLRNRAFGLSLLLFALPNCLPIPGLPILFGMVLVIISLQMIWGRDGLWLPQRVSTITLSREALEKVIGKALPFIVWIEKFCRPRLGVMAGAPARQAVGVMVFILAVLLVIMPFPWLGSAPQGLAIAAFGLGLTERDGVIVSVGFVLAGLAFLVCAAIAYMLWLGVDRFF